MAIVSTVLAVVGVPYGALLAGAPGWLVALLFGAILLAVMAVANHIASGPR